ncbi:MAG: copper resistance protein CopC [Nocardioides sp.]|nr:copper resistance protein CopC [Nocardioides sp.]
MGAPLRRLLPLLLLPLVAVLLLAVPAPAAAHASLLGSDPADGTVLPVAPEQVTFSFNEPVSVLPDGVQVFDARGVPVESAATARGAELVVDLPGEVPEGTLVVVWRIVSEDTHPVAGSLSFSVGAPSAEVQVPPVAVETSTDPPLLLGPARWLGYLGLLLSGGLVVAVLLLLPADPGARAARARLAVAARAAAAAGALGWLVVLPLSVVYQVGGAASALTRGSSWAALGVTEYVAVGAAALGPLVAVGLLGRDRPEGGLATLRWRVSLGVAVLAVVAPSLSGHTRAASAEALVVLADAVHLLAGATWLGGLVALLLVLPDLAGRGALGGEMVVRFSTAAAVVVVALVATGSVVAWGVLDSWAALLGTTYGQLLFGKVLLVLVVVVLAAWNRRSLVPLLHEATRRRDRRTAAARLARVVAAEAALLVVVLALTSALVDAVPDLDEPVPAASGPVAATGELGDLEVSAELSPATVGDSTVTVRIADAAGAPAEGLEPPRVSLSSGSVDLGLVPLTPVVPGTYAGQVVLPTAGTWEVQVSLRTDRFTNPVAVLELEVG